MNFVVTVWDLAHRDSPEFPEVRDMGEFYAREQFYRQALPPAVLVVADSETLKERIARRYGIDRDKVLAMPFAPSPLNARRLSVACEDVMECYALRKGYLFYPAQFWSHKNHVRILQAIAYLNKEGCETHVVFAGGDKGNLAHVRRTADELGVVNQVRFLGFVPAEHMRGLYEGCAAVVVPSYFGPTNLPPLEAWQFERPLLYANLYKEQTGEAALYFDPDDYLSLATAVKEVQIRSVANFVVDRGTQRLAAIKEKRRVAEDEFVRRLQLFQRRSDNWREKRP